MVNKRKGIIMKRLIGILATLILTMAVLTGCSGGNGAALADDATLQITGGGIDITYDAEQLGELKAETFTAENVSSSGEVDEVEIVAIPLSSILSEQGVDMADVKSVQLEASDGYVMSAPASEFAEKDVYIVLTENGEALDYPRSAIPDARAMYWVKYLNKIVIETDEASSGSIEVGPIEKVSIFREGVASIKSKEVSDGDDSYDAFSNSDYFETVVTELPKDDVVMIAEDGLQRTEPADIFNSAFVTIDEDADDTPLYYSDTLKDGMKVKELKYAVIGTNAVYYGDGIDLATLFEELDVADAEEYTFIAADGFEVTVPKAAIESGKLVSEDGVIKTDFGDYDTSSLPGKGVVKNLVEITTAK